MFAVLRRGESLSRVSTLVLKFCNLLSIDQFLLQVGCGPDEEQAFSMGSFWTVQKDSYSLT